MESSIALARVPVAAEGDCDIEIRGKLVAARIVKAPFVRNGKIKIAT
jgi:aminomethyltransferase